MRSTTFAPVQYALWTLICATLALASACSTPPDVTLACKADSDCNNNLKCRLGRCLADGESACEAVADCDKALADGSWTPTTAGVCLQSACDDGLCAMVPKKEATACADDDGLDCTIGACDAAGTCVAAASIAPKTCLMDDGGTKTCVAEAAKRPGSPCLVCVPDQDPRAWTPLATSSPCSPTDGSTCHSYACGPAGSCEDAGLLPDRCEIDGACVIAGTPQTKGESCSLCDPKFSTSTWTDLPDQTSCTVDGQLCRLGECKAGSCIGTGIAADACLIEGTCRKDGEADSTAPCRACAAKAKQDDWSPVAADATCPDDGVACTSDVCDGKGACAHTPNDAACADKDGVCVQGVCDATDTKACKTAPLPTSATCTGADGVTCTVEHCDGAGACEAIGTSDSKLCDDAIACTLDSCEPKVGDPKSGCVHKGVDSACDDGNICTADACDVAKGCAQIANGADCTSDGLACTVQKCADSACKLTIDAQSCVIAGACVAADIAQAGGCQACKPASSQSGWTLQSAGAACTDDGASCTADTCSASGACQHVAKAGACDDGLPCTLDSCEPGSAWAEGKTGCAFVDDCPYGHACDGAAKVCLTPKPVVLVTESADDPAPTNPAAIRVVLDAKTGRQRLWVVYQSQAAAVAKQVKDDKGTIIDTVWDISQASKLRAVVLDPVVAAKPGEPKPKPAIVTFANQVAGSGAIAAFAAVAADPESTSQGWLTWLEAGAGSSPTCLDSNGRGGIARLARLDGAAVPGSGVWSAVAGKTCSLDGGDKPGFMTAGFAMLPGAEVDPGKRGAVWVRPKVDTLQAGATTQFVWTGIGQADATKANATLAEFSTVRPAVVDMGFEDANKARFWALALGEEKSGQTWNRELWALSLDATGAKKATTKWLDSAVAGAGATVLAGVDAVCSLDAAWDGDAGEAVAAIVVRQGGEDRVWLVRGKPGGAFSVTKVTSQTSETPGSCNSGALAARVALALGKTALVTINWATDNFPGNHIYFQVKDGIVGPKVDIVSPKSWATDVLPAGTVRPGLAWRGAAQAMWSNGTWTLALEVRDGNSKRGVAVYTFKP